MNTPNKITLSRVCLIPVVMFFYLATFIPYGKLVAALLFIVACATDFLDGYLARKNNQVTTLGKFFDSIADKALIMAGFVLIIASPILNGSVIAKPNWLGIVCVIIILAREFAVSALRQLAAAKGIVMAADKFGKYKAFMQDILVAVYMLYAFFVEEFYIKNNLSVISGWKTTNAVIAIVLLVFLVITTIITLASGYNYIVKNKAVFKDSQKPVDVKPAVEKRTATEVVVPSATKAKNQTEVKFEKQVNLDDCDPLIPQAMSIFFEQGYGSTTSLQKHLGVGYPRASKIVGQIEELKFIASPDGSKTRKLLVSKEEFDKISQ